MKRWIAWWMALLFISATASADRTAIIFIRPVDAGPNVDIRLYVHLNWVLWPAPVRSDGMNQTLSLASGEDWMGEPGDTTFEPGDGDEPWRSDAQNSLRDRGYFEARNRIVGTHQIVALRSIGGGVSVPALVVALARDGNAKVAGIDEDIAPNSTVAYGARDWDAVKKLSDRVDRAVVVEYPVPPGGQRWSRLWFTGKWPEGLPTPVGVPGLVPASRLVRLVMNPGSASWEPAPRHWTGANRWLDFVRVTGVEVLGVEGLGLMMFLAVAAALAAKERRSKVLSGLFPIALLVPAANLVGGNACVLFGLAAWWPAFIVSLLSLSCAALILAQVAEKAHMHAYLGVAAVSLLATSLGNPLWSFYSPVLGHVSGQFSPVALGVWAASAAGVCRFSHPQSQEWESILRVKEPRWPAIAGLVYTLLCGAFFLWPHRGAALMSGEASVAVVAICAGSGIANRWLMPLLALSPPRHSYALAWSPGNLLDDFGSRDDINLARHVLFLASPGLVALVVVLTLTLLLVDKFFWRQVSRAIRGSNVHRSFLWLTGTLFAMGVLRPEVLPAAYYALFAQLLVLMGDVAGQA